MVLLETFNLFYIIYDRFIFIVLYGMVKITSCLGIFLKFIIFQIGQDKVSQKKAHFLMKS